MVKRAGVKDFEEALHRCNIIMSSEGENCIKLSNDPQSMVETVGLQLKCAKHVNWHGDLLEVTLPMRDSLQDERRSVSRTKLCCLRLP